MNKFIENMKYRCIIMKIGKNLYSFEIKFIYYTYVLKNIPINYILCLNLSSYMYNVYCYKYNC